MTKKLLLTSVLLAGYVAFSFGEDSLSKIEFDVTERTQLRLDVSPDGKHVVIDLLGQLWLIPEAAAKTDELVFGG